MQVLQMLWGMENIRRGKTEHSIIQLCSDGEGGSGNPCTQCITNYKMVVLIDWKGAMLGVSKRACERLHARWRRCNGGMVVQIAR